MNKEELLKYIDESLADLKDEQEYNEYLYNQGRNSSWISKDKGHLPLDSWYGYESLILQLETIKKRIIKEDFIYSWKKREYKKEED